MCRGSQQAWTHNRPEGQWKQNRPPQARTPLSLSLAMSITECTQLSKDIKQICSSNSRASFLRTTCLADDRTLNLNLPLNYTAARCNEPESIWTKGTNRQVWTSLNQLKEKGSVKEPDQATAALTDWRGNVRETWGVAWPFVPWHLWWRAYRYLQANAEALVYLSCPVLGGGDVGVAFQDKYQQAPRLHYWDLALSHPTHCLPRV